MLAAGVLNHIEIEGSVLDSMAELEHFELIFRRSILLVSQLSKHIFCVLVGVLSSHLRGHSCRGHVRNDLLEGRRL